MTDRITFVQPVNRLKIMDGQQQIILPQRPLKTSRRVDGCIEIFQLFPYKRLVENLYVHGHLKIENRMIM